MTVYEYDEEKDKALSIMDGMSGGYSSSEHHKSILVFKMKDNKKFTFRPDSYNAFIITVDTDNSHHVVKIGYGDSSGKGKIEGGIALVTDLGRYRPQSVNLRETFQNNNVRHFKALSIRKLCQIADQTVDEYKNLLKEMNGI